MTARPLPHALALIAGLSSILVLGSCSGEERREGGDAAAGGPNVLLIVIDTLGAESLGCYTDGLTNSPNIDRLAGEGIRFSHAYSTAPWTQPAVASLFTSRTPSDHGVRRIFDELDTRFETLAEGMRARGYRTGGVISHFIIEQKYGYGQGFDRYYASPVGGHRSVSSSKVTDMAIEYLDGIRGEPFFLFVHYFDPHWYYNHHPDFDQTGDYRGRLLPGMEIGGLRARRDELTGEDIAYLEGLYREEIAYTDHHIGRLLAGLRSRGVADDTIVIVTADHGEEFMRHGWIGHTATLYEELIRVPLIFHAPGRFAPRSIDEPVTILDIMPTVLDLAGRREPDGDWQGISLRASLTGDGAPPARPLFAEVSYVSPEGWPSGDGGIKRYFKTAVISGREKLIHDLDTGLWQFYRLDDDPHEQRNAWNADDAGIREKESLLRAWEEGRVQRWDVEPDVEAEADPAAIERLRSLGYVH